MERSFKWLAPVILLIVIGGCASSGGYVWARDAPESFLAPAQRSLQPGDQVMVAVTDQPSLSAESRVTEDGFVLLPVIGAVPVSGQNTEAAQAAIAARLRGIVVSPQVRVVLTARGAPSVGVLGEVRAPGYHEVDPDAGLLEALARAGGLTEFAAGDEIFLLRRGNPPLRIRFTYAELVSGEVKSNAIKLRDGDMIVVD